MSHMSGLLESKALNLSGAFVSLRQPEGLGSGSGLAWGVRV